MVTAILNKSDIDFLNKQISTVSSNVIINSYQNIELIL